MESISDNALMMGVKNGDLDKLGLLFERYKKVLFSFFYNMNHHQESSEDLVQNVFMRILKYRNGFKGNGEFKVWMFHIARNLNVDHYRKNKISNNSNDLDRHEFIKDESLNQENQFEKENELEMLRLAIQRLDMEKREVITLSKLEELKYKEIATILDCSEGAVKVKVFRALNALKAEYRKVQSII